MVTAKNRVLSVILVISLVIGMVGIVSTDTTYATKKKIHLKKTEVTLAIGKTYQQKLIDKKGKQIKATKVKWSSPKPGVVTINKKGKLKAVKTGKVKLTAKYKGKTYKFTVIARKPNLNKKPAITSVYTSYVGGRTYINIKWKTIKDATSYVIYASPNGMKYEQEGLVYGSDIRSGKYQYYSDEYFGGGYSLEESYGPVKFKIIARNGKYKSKFSNEKLISVLQAKYSNSYVDWMIDELGYAVSYSGEITDDVEFWRNDGFDAKSDYLNSLKNDAIGIQESLKTVKQITSRVKSRECRSSAAKEVGFKTWNQMIGDLITQCNYISSTNVESMSDNERVEFAKKALKLSIGVNSAYIEVYDYPRKYNAPWYNNTQINHYVSVSGVYNSVFIGLSTQLL